MTGLPFCEAVRKADAAAEKYHKPFIAKPLGNGLSGYWVGDFRALKICFPDFHASFLDYIALPKSF